MKHERLLRTALAAVAAFTLSASLALAAATPSPQPSPTMDPHPQGGEIAFVAGIQKDLMARFPTSADAVKAGYFRYGNEDNTGAISYANLQWESADPRHPSQLWYDAKGNLLGADFSILQSVSGSAPHLWAVSPRRWDDFPAHVHWVLTDASGKETYGATSITKFVAAGGTTTNPQAATVVALGKASSANAVKRVFIFPALWDLIVWVKPNPAGAFAEKNPLVTPSADAAKDSM